MMYAVVAVLWGAFGWYAGRWCSARRAHDAGYALGRAIEAQRQRDVSRKECERHVNAGVRIGRAELLEELRAVPLRQLAGRVHHPLYHPLCDTTPQALMPRVVEVE